MIEYKEQWIRLFVTEAGTLEICGHDHFEGKRVSFCLHPTDRGYGYNGDLPVSTDCAEPEDWGPEHAPKYELNKEEMTELFKVIRDWIKEKRKDEM